MGSDIEPDALIIAGEALLLVEELKVKVEGLLKQDEQTKDILGGFAEQINDIAELIGAKTPDFLVAPWCWPLLESDQKREAWRILTAFVDKIVIMRYDKGTWLPGQLPYGQRVQRCWFAHCDAVEVFAAYYWDWRRAYKRHAEGTAPLAFQLDWKKKALAFVDEELKNCAFACKIQSDHRGNPLQAEHITGNDRAKWIEADCSQPPFKV